MTSAAAQHRPGRGWTAPLSWSDYLRPAWFDEARFIVQGDVFARTLSAWPLSGRVLNAGCGEGLYAPIIESFPAVTAVMNVDVSRPAVARTRHDDRHRDIQASITQLPFTAHTFDAALCSEVIEHVQADALAIAELARVLKPAGRVLLSVPTPPAPHDPNHVREGYTLDDLTSLLAANGLTILTSAVCMHVYMRMLYRGWQRLHGILGRNVVPRVAVRCAAHVDRRTQWGRPWDLVVLARKTA